METREVGIVPPALFLSFTLPRRATALLHPGVSLYLVARRTNRGKYKLSRRKLVQRTLLILSRDNNYSLFLGRSGGNRFFSRPTGHFVDRAGDPSFIRAATIIFYVHRRGRAGVEGVAQSMAQRFERLIRSRDRA